ncbi:flavin reductase family protein [Nocardia sp. NPDC024068]|uniref:flavin reductase family protein n=1 Tax=Nocardia sp. NPDC024068 TaxID=3157197 RepID=UPI00340812E7
MPENREHSAFDALVATADAPVYVVTLADGAQRAGCLVGFASQVGIEPPRFLICLSETNHTYRVAAGVRYCAVHLLDAGDRALAELFGGRTGDEVDKFARCAWDPGPHGVPVLRDAVAWFCGRILGRHDFGDHLGLLLAPEDGDAPESAPPTLRLHHVLRLEPGHPA